tara:strand:- start:9325 stop:11316 length:1992 start_codon:yes stop_codon:yes gene_type:complete
MAFDTVVKKIVLFLLLTNYILAIDFLKTSGDTIVNESNEKIILQGFGLGGWLVLEGYMWNCYIEHASTSRMEDAIEYLVGEDKKREFFDLYRKNYITEKDVKYISDNNFNALRVPLHYRDFSPNFMEFSTEGFELLDSLVAWGNRYNVYLILDMHAAPGAQNTSDFSDSEINGDSELFTSYTNQRWLASTWKHIANYYKSEPVIAGFDLLNEPARPGVATTLRNIYEQCIDSIRAVNQNHMVIIEGNWYGNDHTGLFPPFDPNIVYSFHHYVGGINDTMTMYNQYRNGIALQYNVPLWVGEFGENSNTWANGIKEFFNRNDVGWSWWNFKSVERISSLFSYKITDEYQNLINYWGGNGIKPDTAEAFAGLISMAKSLHFDSCKVNIGLTRALSDTSFSSKSESFSNFIAPGLLPAVNYDTGNNDVAYYDNQSEDPNKFSPETKSWNNGWSYRNDGVDIGFSNGGTGDYHIGWIEDGEWTKYSIQSEKPDNYKIFLEISSSDNNGMILATTEVGDTLGPINIPNSTGLGDGWRIINIGNISIQEMSTLKIEAISGGFDFKNIIFNKMDISSFPTNFNLICYPNPLNADLNIQWESSFASETQIRIFNLIGNKVFEKNLIATKGLNKLNWGLKSSQDYKNIPSGIYLLKIKNTNSELIKKITYLK